MRLLTPFLLLIAAISFGLGISLPLLKIEKFYFFEETPSLIGLVSGLWQAGDLIIALLVLLFSILFPTLKLFIVFCEAMERGEVQSKESQSLTERTVLRGWMPILAKWSMMDVLLVALVLFAAKTSGLATAFAQPGLWFYTISAISGACAAHLLKREMGGSKLAQSEKVVDQEGARSPGS